MIPFMLSLSFLVLSIFMDDVNDYFEENKTIKYRILIISTVFKLLYYFSSLPLLSPLLEEQPEPVPLMGVLFIGMLFSVVFYFLALLFSIGVWEEKEWIRNLVEKIMLFYYLELLKEHYSKKYARFVYRLIVLAKESNMISLPFILQGNRINVSAEETYRRSGYYNGSAILYEEIPKDTNFTRELAKFINEHTRDWSDTSYKPTLVEAEMTETENTEFMSYLVAILEDKDLARFVLKDKQADKERFYISRELFRMRKNINQVTENYKKIETLSKEEENLKKIQLLKQNSFRILTDFGKEETK